nr:MAG TPA: hypothetical protein [Bacteriophage sp.]
MKIFTHYLFNNSTGYRGGNVIRPIKFVFIYPFVTFPFRWEGIEIIGVSTYTCIGNINSIVTIFSVIHKHPSFPCYLVRL